MAAGSSDVAVPVDSEATVSVGPATVVPAASEVAMSVGSTPATVGSGSVTLVRSDVAVSVGSTAMASVSSDVVVSVGADVVGSPAEVSDGSASTAFVGADSESPGTVGTITGENEIISISGPIATHDVFTKYVPATFEVNVTVKSVSLTFVTGPTTTSEVGTPPST